MSGHTASNKTQSQQRAAQTHSAQVNTSYQKPTYNKSVQALRATESTKSLHSLSRPVRSTVTRMQPHTKQTPADWRHTYHRVKEEQ